ncbi:aminodeoxychorismate/anthranilate synthase component II [Desulfobacterales bacterium HSG2]|nr:aminodeoxychorismate/anthranilate synthase component II [Desulfobacterales bacterium HSG2]
MMILMIDNYDSFTYNLVQYLMELGSSVRVFRNDAISVPEAESLDPAGIVISPGPGRPESAGISLSLVKHFSGKVPILGVCLGHQTIGEVFGGKVVSAKRLMHGKTSEVRADGKGIYRGIRKPFQAMRYHSLSLSKDDVPECLEITAEADDGEIMGVRHREHSTEGIQFHPESIMTPVGKRLLRNFLQYAEPSQVSEA